MPDNEWLRRKIASTPDEECEARPGDNDELREALHDVYFSCSEQDAIGGGPGWQGRYRAAMQRAAEALGCSEPRD